MVSVHSFSRMITDRITSTVSFDQVINRSKAIALFLLSSSTIHAIKRMISIVAVVAASTATVFAQGNNEGSAEHEMWGWTGGIGLSYFAFDKKAADTQLIGDTAFSVDLYANYYFSSRLVATLGMGLMRLDDKAEFSETVLVTTLFDSDVDTVSSDAKAIPLYTEIQYVAPPVSSLAMQFRAGLGYGVVAYADRSIDKCSDCRKEDIDLKGGIYLTGGVFREGWSEQLNIGFNVRQYVSSDVKTTATIWFEYID